MNQVAGVDFPIEDEEALLEGIECASKLCPKMAE
jgi:hypothetical protein